MIKKHLIFIVLWSISIVLGIALAFFHSIGLAVFVFGISTLMLFYVSASFYLLLYLYKRFGKKIISKNFTYLATLLSRREREEKNV